MDFMEKVTELRAQKKALAKSHRADSRLIQVNNAVLGANEGTGADGGFALQEDFAGVILESTVQHSPL